jgi:AmmeMemoRadiSam system protein B
MSVHLRPQLRQHLVAEPEGRNGSYILWDCLQLGAGALRLTAQEVACIALFDGTNTLQDVHAQSQRLGRAKRVSLEALASLAAQLDQATFLEGPRYRARLQEVVESPVRMPACLGSYHPEPSALRRQIDLMFSGPRGPGRPRAARPDARFRGALVPHIDYGRGGATFAWAFKEIVERTPASLFVIIGTSHYSAHRFTATRKHFVTPLGVVQTDQDYVDRLGARYGESLFADELGAHLPEHSIELEVVILKHLLGDCPFRIVPIVVGSFHDAVKSGREPKHVDEIARMVEALQAAERDTKEPVCYLISGDLAHLGPKFGDPGPVHAAQLANSKRQDEAILRQAELADSAGFFRVIAQEGDARRICGLPPAYTVLQALHPHVGKVLHYGQFVDPSGSESVSFAAMALFS